MRRNKQRTMTHFSESTDQKIIPLAVPNICEGLIITQGAVYPDSPLFSVCSLRARKREEGTSALAFIFCLDEQTLPELCFYKPNQN